MTLPPSNNNAVKNQLNDAALEVLRQLAALIETAGSCYHRQPQAGASSIGRHTRHILDHFAALRAAATTGRIDYNARSRGDTIEVDAEAALVKIGALVNWLESRALEDIPVEIESEVSVSRYENVCIAGSLHREVIYVINHTIHHIAYAKMIAGKMGIELDSHLGIAPATATYLRSTECVS